MTPPPTSPEFRWLTPLGFSVASFLLSGGLYILIGGLTPVAMDSAFGRRILMMSNRTDEQFFGTEPTRLLSANAEMAKLRSVMSGFIGGAVAAVGVLIVVIAWFGLRAQHSWALAALSGTGLLMILAWYLSLRPYLAAGITFALGDLPPLFWIPAALWIPATVLGILGLR